MVVNVWVFNIPLPPLRELLVVSQTAGYSNAQPPKWSHRSRSVVIPLCFHVWWKQGCAGNVVTFICASGYLLQIWQQCLGLPLRNFLKTQCDCIRQTSTVCDTIWLEILAVQTIGYSPRNRQGICWQSIYLAMWNLDYDFILNINFRTYRIEAKDIL